MHESEDSCKITGGRHLGIRSLSSIDNDMITQQDLAFTGEELRAMQDTTADSTTLKGTQERIQLYLYQLISSSTAGSRCKTTHLLNLAKGGWFELRC